jgi:tetratricopeptide (TPR) repeat protein
VSGARRVGVTLDVALAALLTAGFATIVFVATGGSDLAPNTWVQIALLVFGAACAVALVLAAPRGRASGVAAVGLFAALAALTYLSIAWSVQPATSWTEANRTLSYLAAFAGAAALARLAPARWPALTGAIGAVAVVVCGYALLCKVFPATLNAGDHLGRLRPPFDYWNATGLMAAVGLPVCLWAGARPVRRPVMRALTVPAIAILFTALILSYSRGALLAAVVGLACWFALAPLRLRAVAVLALGVAGGGIATIWALAHHAITHDNATLAARTAAGHPFGLVLVAVVVLSGVAGLAATVAMDRIALSGQLRRRIGTALIVLVALVPVAGVAGAAASSRGLTGQVSHAWNTLTSASSSVGNNPGRLGELGNSRGLYWREGLKVGEHALLAGVGAGGFDTARTRYTTNSLQVAHAHSYLIETFADLGLIGVAVSLALLAAWALACRRALAPARGDQRHAAERTGLITLLAVVVTFGVSSLIDWTWFVPGVAVPALVAAGWLAGRGPVDAVDPDVAVRRQTGGLAFTPGRSAATIGVLVATVLAAFFVWQPLHSADSFGAAISAMSRGDTAAALADARTAADSDPVSVDPLLEESFIYGALQDQASARTELVKATSLQPDNPQTWMYLGAFDLQAHRPRLALAELETAHRLDLTSAAISQQLGQARTELLSATPARTGSA